MEIVFVPIVENWTTSYNLFLLGIESGLIKNNEWRLDIIKGIKVHKFQDEHIKSLYDQFCAGLHSVQSYCRVLATLNTAFSSPETIMLLKPETPEARLKFEFYDSVWRVRKETDKYGGDYYFIDMLHLRTSPTIKLRVEYYWSVDTITQEWKLFRNRFNVWSSWKDLIKRVEGDVNTLKEYEEELREAYEEQEIYSKIYANFSPKSRSNRTPLFVHWMEI